MSRRKFAELSSFGRFRYWMGYNWILVVVGFMFCAAILFGITDCAGGSPYTETAVVVDRVYVPSKTTPRTYIDSDGDVRTTTDYESTQRILIILGDKTGRAYELNVSRAHYASVSVNDTVLVDSRQGKFTNWFYSSKLRLRR